MVGGGCVGLSSLLLPFLRSWSLHCQWPRARSLAELAFTQMSSSKCWSYPIYPQSKARLQRFAQKCLIPQHLNLCLCSDSDGARPHPLAAVVVVANDIMLLLIWMRSNVQSVQTNTRRNAGQGNGCGWALQSLHSKVVTPVSPDQRCDVTCPMSARCRYKIVPTRQF